MGGDFLVSDVRFDGEELSVLMFSDGVEEVASGIVSSE